jgi:hypothetical protein
MLLHFKHLAQGELESNTHFFSGLGVALKSFTSSTFFLGMYGLYQLLKLDNASLNFSSSISPEIYSYNVYESILSKYQFILLRFSLRVSFEIQNFIKSLCREICLLLAQHILQPHPLQEHLVVPQSNSCLMLF